MKCPKCGYTSFDYLDSCKKCGTDLSNARAMLGVIAISPDEMALATPSGSPPEEELSPLAEFENEFQSTSFEEETLPSIDEEEVSFDDSMSSFVEPTSYGPASALAPEEDLSTDDFLAMASPDAAPKAPPPPPPPPPKPAQPKEEDDEFLDLDFGGIFEDEEKK